MVVEGNVLLPHLSLADKSSGIQDIFSSLPAREEKCGGAAAKSCLASDGKRL
jgi:hypothetical protein